MCDRTRGLEGHYFSGVLPEKDEISMTKHLEACLDCRKILQDWQKKDAQL